MEKIKVIIADDYDIVRFALREFLEKHQKKFSLENIFEAESGKMVVELIRSNNPDLVIMDLLMPEMNGIEVSRQIKKIAPFCRIIILAGYHKKNHLRQLLQMRVSGIVHKSHALKELSDAIDTVLRGGVYWSPKIGSWLMEDYVSILAGKEPSIYNEKLTERQKEVLKLIAEGKGTKEIALHLKTSIASVESLRYRLMHKLNVNNMADLIKYALQEGIIDWNI